MTLYLVLCVVVLLVTGSSCRLLTDANHANHADYGDHTDYNGHADHPHHVEHQIDHADKQGDYTGFVFYADHAHRADHSNHEDHADHHTHVGDNNNQGEHKEHHAHPDITKLLLPLLKESNSDSIEILPKKHSKLSKQLIQVLPIRNKHKKHNRKKHVVEITPVHGKEAGGKPLAYILATADADKIIATQELASQEFRDNTIKPQSTQEFHSEPIENKHSRTLAENMETLLLAPDSSSESQTAENTEYNSSSETITNLSPLEIDLLPTNIEAQITNIPLKTEETGLTVNTPIENLGHFEQKSEVIKNYIERTPGTSTLEENENIINKKDFKTNQNSDVTTVKLIKPIFVNERSYDQTEVLGFDETDLVVNISSEVIKESSDDLLFGNTDFGNGDTYLSKSNDIRNVNTDIIRQNTDITRENTDNLNENQQNDSPYDNIKDTPLLYNFESDNASDNKEAYPFLPESQTDVSKLTQLIPTTQVTPRTVPCYHNEDARDHKSYILSFLFNK